MMQNYTSNQIIKYLYHELPVLEHFETEYAIEHDQEWKSTYERLKGALSALPKIQFFPRHSVVRSIMQYSTIAS